MVIRMGSLHRSPSQICHNPLLPAPQQAESRAPDHRLGSYLSSLTVGVGADGESRTRTTLAGLRILSPLRSPSHVRIRWPTRLFVQPLRPFGRCHTHARSQLGLRNIPRSKTGRRAKPKAQGWPLDGKPLYFHTLPCSRIRKNSTPRSSAARACRTELERQTALPQIVGDLLSSNSQGRKIILRHISAVNVALSLLMVRQQLHVAISHTGSMTSTDEGGA